MEGSSIFEYPPLQSKYHIQDALSIIVRTLAEQPGQDYTQSNVNTFISNQHMVFLLLKINQGHLKTHIIIVHLICEHIDYSLRHTMYTWYMFTKLTNFLFASFSAFKALDSACCITK